MHDNNSYSKVNFNIAVTGILLGLALLFQYLSNFMSIAEVMSINLSLAFIVPIFFVANYKFGMMAIITKFVIGIFMNPGAFGGVAGEAVGQLILLFAGLLYVGIVILFKNLKLLNTKQAMVIGLFVATILCSLVMSTLNGLLFVPLYNAVLGYGFTWSIFGAPWGIGSYWGIVFAIFMVGNIANYGVTSFILIPVFKFIRPHIKKEQKTKN